MAARLLKFQFLHIGLTLFLVLSVLLGTFVYPVRATSGQKLAQDQPGARDDGRSSMGPMRSIWLPVELFKPRVSQSTPSAPPRTSAPITSSAADAAPFFEPLENCCESGAATNVAAPERLALPDLIVTDIWEEAGSVFYQVRNIGQTTVTLAHEDGLSVDGSAADARAVAESIAPGERYSGTFSAVWSCSGITDTLRVTADVTLVIEEENEENNARQETWYCDTQYPHFSLSPQTTLVTTDTAVIEWETDEDAEGVLWYGTQPGFYSDLVHDPIVQRTHQVTLTGLSPATTYGYRVQAIDPSGNESRSADLYFVTEAPSSSPLIPELTVAQRDPVALEVTARLTDVTDVDWVAFYLDGEFALVDYTPSGPDPGGMFAFQFILHPAFLGWTRAQYFRGHDLEVAVFSPDGSSTTLFQLFDPPTRTMPVDLQILTPYQEYRLLAESSPLPDPTMVEIEVEAVAYEWDCAWPSYQAGDRGDNPYARPPECSDVAQLVSRLDLSVLDAGDNILYTDTAVPSAFTHSFDWNAAGLAPGTYRVRVVATAGDGSNHAAAHDLHIVAAEPRIAVSRTVLPDTSGTALLVQLTVKNASGAAGPAYLNRMTDWVRGLQPVQKADASYTVDSAYADSTRLNQVNIDFVNPLALNPGQEFTIEYVVVPILYEDGSTQHVIGSSPVIVEYEAGGQTLTDQFRITHDLPESVIARLTRSADYLVVTNPQRLLELFASPPVNGLLAKMAHLAWRKQGVLGYLQTYAGSEATLDGLIEPGGYWAEALYSGFNAPLGGYVLLVGETEILPGWSRSGLDLCWDSLSSPACITTPDLVRFHDHFYAHTGGSGAPDLILGRAVGNDPVALIAPLQNTIGVYEGQAGYSFDPFGPSGQALLVSGTGDDANDFLANVNWVGDRLASDGWWVDTIDWQTVPGSDRTSVFTTSVANRELVLFSGYGDINTWDPGLDTSHFPLDFSQHNPVVLAFTGLTANYEDGGDDGIAEAFFDSGAGAYVGMTQVSPVPIGLETSQWFVDSWSRNEALGRNFTQVERAFWDAYSFYDWNRFWVYGSSFLGDPKYGETSGAKRATRVTATQAPTSALQIQVPAFQVTTTADGVDHVEIPGGMTVLESGWYPVPYWSVVFDTPPGYRVQDVVLTARSGLGITTGLNIPATRMADPAGMLVSGANHSTDAPLPDEAWFPDLAEIYRWQTSRHPDGSGTLHMQLFPFYYNFLTSDARFYRDYTFEVQYVTTNVVIDQLALDQGAYAQEDAVSVDLWVSNSGEPQDVIVKGSVNAGVSDQAVTGLDLRLMRELVGLSSLSLQWDSVGLAPGEYSIVIEVLDSNGNLLDSASEEFVLGIAATQVASLSATPGLFRPGDPVSLSMVIRNTGSVPITGTAMIQVQAAAGVTVTKSFSQTVAGLNPASEMTFDRVWDTLGVAEGDYRIIGYVKHGAKTSEILQRTVTAVGMTEIYLPTILRSG
jgi:hypothetical protein